MKAQTIQNLASRLWRGRSSFPEKQVGEYRIAHEHHERGDKLMLVNFRDALMTGLPKCDFLLKEPATVHKLTGPTGTWMTDFPCELVQMHRDLASKARGTVLIGGLGLGLVANMVVRKPNVTRVLVVELQPEVVELVQPHLSIGVEVVQGDIHEYVDRLSTLSRTFNVALLDTWAGTGEWVWQTEVVPLKRAIGTSIKRVYCWQEQVMLTQVSMGMVRACSLPAEVSKSRSRCHYYAFVKAVEAAGARPVKVDLSGDQVKEWASIVEAEEENRRNPVVRLMASSFLHEVGSPSWERMYGKFWDEALGAKE